MVHPVLPADLPLHPSGAVSAMPSVRILYGNLFDVLPTIDVESVDACVTDPPYGLEFMGKDWDAPWKRGDGIGCQDSAFSEVVMRDGARRLPKPNYSGTSTNPKCK